MIVTTTVSVEGRRITEYKVIVFGEVISGVNFVRDVAASFSNFFKRYCGVSPGQLKKQA